MPVGLSPSTTPPIKSESVAISANYSNLSITCWPRDTAGAAYFPNHPQPISARAHSVDTLTPLNQSTLSSTGGDSR